MFKFINSKKIGASVASVATLGLFSGSAFAALDTTAIATSLTGAQTDALAVGILVMGVVAGIAVIGLGISMIRKV